MIKQIEARMMLIILDGWGHSPDPAVSAIDQASTPVMDSLYEKYPNAELTTHGLAVGLPPGQMGNSEVGHLNIGAGRVIDQELVRIFKAIQSRSLDQNSTLLAALLSASQRQARIHLCGLLSDGGVHSHIEHLKALCDIISKETNVPVFVHAFTDGRDVDPHSGLGFVRELSEHISSGKIQLASIIGRYYAMDRDKRWERTRKAYDLLVHGQGFHTHDLLGAIEASYASGVTDEFILPIVKTDSNDVPIGTIQTGDLILFFNFRTDRPRQLLSALSQQDYPEYAMHRLMVDVVTMTAYDQTFKDVKVLFKSDDMSQTLGEIISKLGKTQLRIAETEKYPHVTYFFSGGRETAFNGEARVMIPSPKVATYDLQPEMSARGVTDAAIKHIVEYLPDFVCLNYANADMVGHTGVFAAAIRAVETVDTCLGRLLKVVLEKNYGVIVIADHGNADTMVNPDGSPHTSHTMNPVPVIYVSNHPNAGLHDGKLADLAPTILYLLGIDVPDVMSGNNLLVET